MNSRAYFQMRKGATVTAALVALSILPTGWSADSKLKNPAGKIYVSDITGESQIDTGQKIEDLVKRSVYNVQGTVIETKSKSTDSLVYSNGTGVFFDSDTRVEIKRFSQEPFTPNRTDMEVEPSISQTHAYVARGIVGICTSKLVAGSNMTYRTPHASVNIRGRKLVIEVNDAMTKISMLDGDCTVRGGDLDMGGRILHSGEQATVRPGQLGKPNLVEIEKIPDDAVSTLEEKVTMACMSKRTVYFETRDAAEQAGPGLANAFGADDTSGLQIVAIPVVPTNLTPDITISPSTLTGTATR